MISAELFWPLIGLCAGCLLGGCGIGLVRLLTRNRSEGWFIAGADVVVVLLFGCTVAMAIVVSMILSTRAIGLNHQETFGFILGVCAFDAGALAGMLGSLLAEVSRRRELAGHAPLMLLLRSVFPARSASTK